MRPNGRSLDLYVDADFAGNWDRSIADVDESTSHSRHGYVLMYCGMPILWASQLQQITVLSTTEGEYVGLSRSVQDTLPILRLLQEMEDRGFQVHTHKAKVHCKVFEDNSVLNPRYLAS